MVSARCLATLIHNLTWPALFQRFTRLKMIPSHHNLIYFGSHIVFRSVSLTADGVEVSLLKYNIFINTMVLDFFVA